MHASGSFLAIKCLKFCLTFWNKKGRRNAAFVLMFNAYLITENRCVVTSPVFKSRA